jgi:hypothetical protein
VRRYAEQLAVESYFVRQSSSFSTYWLGLRQSWAPGGTGVLSEPGSLPACLQACARMLLWL